MHTHTADTTVTDPLNEAEAVALTATRLLIVRTQDRLRHQLGKVDTDRRADLTRLDETLHQAGEAIFRALNVASSYCDSANAERSIDSYKEARQRDYDA